MTSIPDEPSSQSTPPGARASLGTGTELWLARHAEVHEDWQGRAYGDLDVPLSASGEERSRELVPLLAALKPALILSSPLSRARVLGEAVAERADAPVEVHDGLREVNRGSWQGRSVADLHAADPTQIDAFYADPWNWRGHGGESDSMLAARVWPVVEDALKRVRGRPIVITSHYNVIRVIASGALGIPPSHTFGFRVDTGRVSLFVDAPGVWRLVCSNVSHPKPPSASSDLNETGAAL